MEFVRDTIAIVGLGTLFGGLWWIWPPIALVVLGIVLLAGVVLSSTLHGTNRNDPQ